ncbi:MAG TPA: AAA family ATPase [Streptosporangiaceae bacterium]|nr:AAA family ATPase [Streptosporangiaceae bacterium]
MPTGTGPENEPYAKVAETHSAVVFFAGNRVCKQKKPVNLGFLDFTTLDAREVACLRETELNRRFAPDVYLGVAEVRDPGGEACEHLVVMRRMPASRQLSALIRAGTLVADQVREVARILAVQHASAPRSAQVSAQGSRDALLGRWEDNLSQAAGLPGQVLDPGVLTETGQLARQFLAGRGPLLAGRVSAGRIVDGHGDLLADDIYCLDDGPRILDCLDFDDKLRWLDGLDDAAFLMMDLERLCAPVLARQFADWYAEFSGDPAPASLRHHYVAYRAFVRAKVSCIKAGQETDGAEMAGSARRLAEISLRHLRAGAVTLVLIGGLPGSGKSALARAAADRLGFAVLNSDRIRKELAGIEPAASAAAAYGAGIYTAEWTGRCYAELLHRAETMMAHGESVIADASWISAEHRAAAEAAARRVNAQLAQVRCEAPGDLMRQRMARRTADASDADAEIARQMAAVAASWPAATAISTESGGAGGDLKSAGFTQLVDEVLTVIRPHGPEHVWRPTRPVMLPG